MAPTGEHSLVPTREQNRERLLELVGWAFVFGVLSEVGIFVAVVFLVSFALIPLGAGLAIFLAFLPFQRSFVDWHRIRAGRILGKEISRPYLPLPQGNWLTQLRAVTHDPATWRDLAWLLANAIIGLFLCVYVLTLVSGIIWYLCFPAIYLFSPDGLFDIDYWYFAVNDLTSSYLVLPFGIAFLLLFWKTAAPAMRLYAGLADKLLSPTQSSLLTMRVRELAESRADTVDTQAAELRRIERDLHDGAQARLVALGMSLGMAESVLAKDPGAAQSLLAEARLANSQALAELRDLVRGVHPPVLAERGLAGAVEAFAVASPLETDVQINIPGRLDPPVESASYFAVVEALTNVIKHSGATRAEIRMRHDGEILTMQVTDHGAGGADLQGGTGLRGIQRRLSAFDGRLDVISPVGGPTVVTMELPCVLSSPRTSPSSGTA
jgi:signal transduction histidine kinase